MATATGSFYTQNGEIISPDGSTFVARGINVMEGQQPTAAQILADFPGINFVRLAIYDYASPAALTAYVDSLTSAGIVVELENHNNGAGSAGGGQGTIFTGTALAQEQAWYASIATAFKSNPYVWFGTNNEPSETDSSGNNDPAALSAWQETTYNTIRATGNTNPIMLETTSWGATQTDVGYAASDYAGMHNVIWDQHYYGWVSGYSTSQTTVTSDLTSIISEAQQITGADGKIPVLIGEYGNSTTGSNIDPNGSQVVTAVQQAVTSGAAVGSAAWAWAVNPNGDGLISGGTTLSSYGQQIAAAIAAEAASSPTAPVTPVTPPTVKPSNNDTVVLAGSTSTVTDASGNKWTISGGVVDENGVAAGYSANVTEIAYVDGTVWQENSDKLWWSWSGQTWTGTGTATSPLPASVTPPVTPSSSITVTAGGVAAAVAASGTTDGDTFVLSGTTAKVTTGSTATTLSFLGLSSVTLTGGSAATTVTTNTGTGTFTAGTGALTVTGGTGADAYVYKAGDGKLTITDFSVAKGDTITVGRFMLRGMSETSDGNGGTLITFRHGAGSIDLQHVTTVPAILHS